MTRGQFDDYISNMNIVAEEDYSDSDSDSEVINMTNIHSLIEETDDNEQMSPSCSQSNDTQHINSSNEPTTGRISPFDPVTTPYTVTICEVDTC